MTKKKKEPKAKKRRLMNYQRGDDLIHGWRPHGVLKRIPGGVTLIDRDKAWKRTDAGPKIKSKHKRFGYCFAGVLTVSTLTMEQAYRLLHTENLYSQHFKGVKTVEVDLSYPLSRTVTVQIKPMIFKCEGENPREWSTFDPGYILWQVSKAYLKIYKREQQSIAAGDDPTRYGVWGHCLNDLCFEMLRPHESGYCELFIGS